MKNFAKTVSAGVRKVLLGLGMAVLVCGSANAQGGGRAQGAASPQGLVMQRNLSLATAKTIAEGALEACQAKGYHTAVAVVDRAGQMLVMLRDEQATAQHAEMARRKAYTARMFRITTLDFQKRTADPALAAQRNLPDILALGGGVPIKWENETIGAVGSAGSNQQQDDACAKAGIEKVADRSK
jgi:uncharacterized protein GlcG (DUF336 family)